MDEDPIVAYSLLTCGIIILICVILGLVRLCCKSGTSGMTRVGYPVAISNRLFNESFSFFVLASEVFDRESIVLLYFQLFEVWSLEKASRGQKTLQKQ